MFRARVARLRQRDPHRQHVRRVEADGDSLQRPEAPEHEASANEQQHRERHLRHDERVTEALAAAAARDALGAVLERVGQIDAQRAQRRREAEEHARQERDDSREDENGEVEPDARDARDVGWIPPRHQSDAGVRQAKAEDRARGGQHEALRQELTQHPHPVGPERRAHGHLALPRLGAREQQVRHVGAGDEQQETDRTEEQPDRASDGTDDFVGEREDHGVELHLNRVEPFARHGARDPAQLVGGLPHGRTRLQPAGRVKAVAAVIGGGRVHLQRRPQLRRFGVAKISRQHEARRHDADDLEGVAVDEDRSADDRGIGGVAPVPESVTKDDEPGTVGEVLLGRERAADHRRDAERRERVGADARARDALGFLAAGQVHLSFAPGRDLLQRPAAPAIVHDLALGHPGLVERRPLAPDHHRAIGLGPRQRPEEHGVEHAEDGGVGADPERERQDGNGREAWTAEERARPEPEVLPECFEECGAGHNTCLRAFQRDRAMPCA